MNVNQSIFGFVREALVNPNKVRIEYYNRKFTEREFLSLSLRVAGYLERGGYAGKTVGIMLPDIPEALFTLYGASAAGSTVNLINPRIKREALEKNILKTETSIIFILDMIYEQHRDMLARLGVKAIICSPLYYRKGFELAYLAYNLTKIGATRFAEVANGEEGVAVDSNGEDIAVYIHSGGTTGECKTATISARALNSLAYSVVDTVHEDRSTIPPNGGMLAMLPIFHGYGLGICVHTIIIIMRVVLVPLFKPKEAAKLIKSKHITHLAGVPQMYAKLAAEPSFKGRRLKNIVYVFCGGDRLTPDVKARFDGILREWGSSAEILEGYGLTETASVVTVNPAGRVKPLSQGVPLKGNRVKITDDEGCDLPAGKVGNIELAPLSLMSGYYGETEPSVTYRDSDGIEWLRTGDLGYLDEEGYLFFKERRKRTIKIAAINIFPSEIESVVGDIEGIKECCAARATDEKGKPYIKLYVRIEDDSLSRSALFGKICTEIKNKIVRYAVPRQIVEIHEPLKRTQFQKVDFKYYEEEA